MMLNARQSRGTEDALEENLNALDVVYDARTHVVRDWAEGDDENDDVSAIKFAIIAGEANGTNHQIGGWEDEHLRKWRLESDELELIERVAWQAAMDATPAA